MAQRQLNIRSDDASERASMLARRLGKTTTEVVEEALRVYETKVTPLDERGLTAEQRRRFEALEDVSKRMSERLIAGASADQDWMYDEFGLPK